MGYRGRPEQPALTKRFVTAVSQLLNSASIGPRARQVRAIMQNRMLLLGVSVALFVVLTALVVRYVALVLTG